jgi:hypothetical protein
VTVIARWHYPGVGLRELRWWAFVLAALIWMVAALIVLEQRWSLQLTVLAAALGAWIGWRWLRRTPADLEVILEPDRLRFRKVGAESLALELLREDTGALLAAETGVDWRERYLLLADKDGREVLRVRAGLAQVAFPDAEATSANWWRSTMPSGSSPGSPPHSLPVTALVGAWWPWPDRRRSLRGSLGSQHPWKEASLGSFEAWDRRQRRLNGLLVIGLLVFVYVGAIVGTQSWTVSEIVAFGGPGIVGLALLVRALLR